jgi:hypothetical protein
MDGLQDAPAGAAISGIPLQEQIRNRVLALHLDGVTAARTAKIILDEFGVQKSRNAIIGLWTRAREAGKLPRAVAGKPQSAAPPRAKPTPPATPSSARVDGEAKHGSDCRAQNAGAPTPQSAVRSRGDGRDHDAKGRSGQVDASGEVACESDDPLEDATSPADGIVFAEHRNGQCKWPLGDPRNFEQFRFCGAPAVDRFGKADLIENYCPHHRSIAFVPRSQRA